MSVGSRVKAHMYDFVLVRVESTCTLPTSLGVDRHMHAVRVDTCEQCYIHIYPNFADVPNLVFVS